MHPILFYIPSPWGAVPVYSYGVMLGLSLVAAWYLVMWLGATREGMDRDVMSTTFIVTAVAAIVGSRVLYVATNLGEFHSFGDYFALRQGGLVAYGGFLGGLAGSYFFLRRAKMPLLPWADVAVPSLCSGLMITRIGCYLFGCDFGARLSPSAPAWLKKLGTFPHWDFSHEPRLAWSESQEGAPAFEWHVQKYQLDPQAHASFPVHPTQLYESAAGLVLFGLTMWAWRARQFRGQPLFVLTIGYGIWRFFIEMVRDDPERGGVFGFSTSQLISMALVPVAAFAYFHFWRKAKEAGFPEVPSLRSPPLPEHAEPTEEDKPVEKKALAKKRPRKKR